MNPAKKKMEKRENPKAQYGRSKQKKETIKPREIRRGERRGKPE